MLPGFFYCYLRGGSAAYSCPGAKKSIDNIYYTEDPRVCLEPDLKRGGEFVTVHHVNQTH